MNLEEARKLAQRTLEDNPSREDGLTHYSRSRKHAWDVIALTDEVEQLRAQLEDCEASLSVLREDL